MFKPYIYIDIFMFLVMNFLVVNKKNGIVMARQSVNTLECDCTIAGIYYSYS